MYHVEIRCRDCDSVIVDLDVVLDVGDTIEIDDECWSCGSTDQNLFLRYASEQQKTYQGYATGPAFEVSTRD